MHLRTEFDVTLSAIEARRQAPIRAAAFGREIGRQPSRDGIIINRLREKLEGLSEVAISRRLAKQEFRSRYRDSASFYCRGLSHRQKIEYLNFRLNQLDWRTFIYIFWDGPVCLYVGRTSAGDNRPTEHIDKKWMRQAKRITLYRPRSAAFLSSLECLGSHLFRPLHEQRRPAHSRYHRQCPVCSKLRIASSQIRQITCLRRRAGGTA